jgi:hypothetical protein
MVEYKRLQVFDLASTAVEVDPAGGAVIRCFDSKGTPVHLHMSRSALEKLRDEATRELERVPKPARGQSSQ